ncbi:LysR family transcriptional regulator [Corallococcus soli]|uniref:LysR family transcriptional regulator n=2 Tax=Corallococcus TaxID=83461 RepID=A0A3A8PSK3_9BACT|nr:LysR family transcriptional regulator [Corallococcus aberystwythensis]
MPFGYAAIMELRHVRYFAAVAEQLSVTRAAQLLHISQPALSRQIRDLEEELGVDLLERYPNSIALTEAGKVFLAECKVILRRVEDAVEKVRRKSPSHRSILRIGFAATPAVEILKQAMRVFHKQHPSIQIELKDLSSNGIVRGVRDLKLDLGITIGVAPQSFEGLAMKELGSYGVTVAFPKEHRFAKLKQVPLAEVAKEGLITFTKSEHPEAHSAIRKILSGFTEEPNIVMECDGISSLFAAVESGKGVAIGFETMAKLAGSRLNFRPVLPAPPRLPVVVIYDQAKLSSAGNDFLAILAAVKLKSLRPAAGLLIV